MDPISNKSNSPENSIKQLLFPKKLYSEYYHSNGIFVRHYNNRIIGFGSHHIHHSNSSELTLSIQRTIFKELDELKEGTMVLLEGGGGTDTRQMSKEVLNKHKTIMEERKNSCEMKYALSKVCKLKVEKNKDINARFPEPKFSDQLDFLIDHNVPIDLVFSFLILRNIPQVLNDMAKASGGSMDQTKAPFKTVEDFIDASLTPIIADEKKITSADLFQLTYLLKSITNSKHSVEFSQIIQDNGQPKPTKVLLQIAFDIAKSHMPFVNLESLIKNSHKANDFTAPINQYNLMVPELSFLQRELHIRSLNKAPLPKYRQQTFLLEMN